MIHDPHARPAGQAMIARAPWGALLDPALGPAKAFLRIDGSADDDAIAGFVAAAAGLCEAFTGQALLARAMIETVAADGGWRRLSASPVLAITGVATGNPAVPLAVATYRVDIDADGSGWVAATAAGLARVSYTAGLASDWATLPDPLRAGIIRLAAHFYANRDRADDAGPPAAVAALWRPFRRMQLA